MIEPLDGAWEATRPMAAALGFAGVKLDDIMSPDLLRSATRDDNGYTFAALVVDGVEVGVEGGPFEPGVIFYFYPEDQDSASAVIRERAPSLDPPN